MADNPYYCNQTNLHNVELPLVTIAFPIHKSNDFYLKSLESLELQTYDKLEILVIDSSLTGIQFPKVSRYPFKVIRVSSNYGLSDSLNVAIKNAKGKYLARLDFDDYCLPDRIFQQVLFLEKNLEVSFLGTAAYVITGKDESLSSQNVIAKPTTHEQILSSMLYKNPLLHPTVMLRLTDLTRFNLLYNPNFDGAEDYDLWVRASHKTFLANLEIPLLALRHHDAQFSKVDRQRSEFLTYRIRTRHLFWMARKRMISLDEFLLVAKNISTGILRMPKRNLRRTSINKFAK